MVPDGQVLPAEVELPPTGWLREAPDTVVGVHVDDEQTAAHALAGLHELHGHAGRESFSLLFVCPDLPVLQSSYVIEHGNLGSFALVRVPNLSEAAGQAYGAVVNRAASQPPRPKEPPDGE